MYMKAQKAPFLSLIIPVYNTERFLPRCLDSILRQNYPNMEIICVDDASADRCGEILHQYAKQYPFIRVFQSKQKGVANARNTGLKHARGERIGFVDSDDFLLPNALETAVSYLSDDIDLLIWGYQLYFESQKAGLPERTNIRRDGRLYFKGKKNFSFRVARHTSVVLWNKLFRAEIIRRRGISFPQDTSFGEDNAFFWKYFLYCRKAYFLPQSLYAYVQHPASVMNRLGKCSLPERDTHMYIAEDIYRFYQRHHAVAAHIKELEKICLWTLYFIFANIPQEKRPEAFERGKRFFQKAGFQGHSAAVRALLYGNMEQFLSAQQKGSLLEKICSVRNINGCKFLTLFGINIPLCKK